MIKLCGQLAGPRGSFQQNIDYQYMGADGRLKRACQVDPFVIRPQTFRKTQRFPIPVLVEHGGAAVGEVIRLERSDTNGLLVAAIVDDRLARPDMLPAHEWRLSATIEGLEAAGVLEYGAGRISEISLCERVAARGTKRVFWSQHGYASPGAPSGLPIFWRDCWDAAEPPNRYQARPDHLEIVDRDPDSISTLDRLMYSDEWPESAGDPERGKAILRAVHYRTVMDPTPKTAPPAPQPTPVPAKKTRAEPDTFPGQVTWYGTPLDQRTSAALVEAMSDGLSVDDSVATLDPPTRNRLIRLRHAPPANVAPHQPPRSTPTWEQELAGDLTALEQRRAQWDALCARVDVDRAKQQQYVRDLGFQINNPIPLHNTNYLIG